VLNGNTLSTTKGNSIVLSGAVDLDADPTNEIQSLKHKKDTLSISKANFIVLPKDNDADSTNEIQTLQQSGNSVSLSKTAGSIDVAKTSNVQNGSIIFATASGTNNINLTLSNSPLTYNAGMIINFKTVANNTGAVTINVNGLGPKPLLKNVTDTLEANDITSNQMASIIYDGNNFQFLVAPFAKKAIKLSSDSVGGLVPKNALIATESEISPYGYVYSGINFPSQSKITIVNADSVDKPVSASLKFLGKYNNMYLFTNQSQNPFVINYFDTISKNWTNLTSLTLNNYNFGGSRGFNVILSGNSIFLLATYPTNPSASGIQFTIREYNLLTNTWVTRFDNNYCCYLSPDPGFFLNYHFINNNYIYMDINVYINGIFLNNTSNTSTFYKFNLSNNTFTRMPNNLNYQVKYLSNNLYGYNNSDSIYKYQTNETWQYVATIPKFKLSSTNASINNFWFIGQYKFNALSNNISVIADKSFSISSGKILGNYLYSNDSYSDTLDFQLKGFSFDPKSDYLPINADNLFESNYNYLWGLYNGIIFIVEKPKTYLLSQKTVSKFRYGSLKKRM
jgi:hypothetical protein